MIHGLGKRASLQRIGKLRIGEKSERGLPRSIDHFRVVMDEGFDDVLEAIAEQYGSEPKELIVYLPANPDFDEVWSPWYRRYTTAGLVCKGDGLTGVEIQRGGEKVERPCAEKGCPFAEPDEKGRVACKPVGILSLKVYGIEHPGTLHLTMGGWFQVDLAHRFLMLLMEKEGGDAAGVPFKISTERIKGRKGVFTRINFGYTKLPRIEVAVEAPPVEPELPEPEEGLEHGPGSELAEVINEAVEAGLLVGVAKKRALETLSRIPLMGADEAAAQLESVRNYLNELRATWNEPVSEHASDKALAEAVWERYGEEALREHGIASPEDMTRGQAREFLRELGG